MTTGQCVGALLVTTGGVIGGLLLAFGIAGLIVQFWAFGAVSAITGAALLALATSGAVAWDRRAEAEGEEPLFK